MARDRGPPVLRQPPAPPRLPAALPAEPRGWGWLGAGLWPALVVGLLAALVAWLWYGSGDGRGEESGGEAAGEAPRARGEAESTENLASGKQVLQQAKAAAPSSPREAGEDAPQHNHAESSRAACRAPEGEQLLPKPCAAASEPDAGQHPADGRDGQAGQPRPQVGQASDGWCMMSSGGVCKDGGEEQLGQPAQVRDLDEEEWEVVSEHLDWGEAGKNGSVEDADSKEWEQGDCPDGDLKAKRVAAVPPMFQNIHVTFRVHYITHSDTQLIGVTGDHECLGQWHSYVPLKYDKDGFWSECVSLPVDTKVEWKFILVENGKVTRWEECGNRTLVTEHEDQITHQWWGHH
ncbi:starch-binding domain-containing protein 1 [Oxyura jamaicensis]|uniref:starch-binding domain-containing protein 1 n=1 Tax=Oxyura jamaicensis TaxID=8884 RepID=UPI0015A5F2F4|nr:starch-binding domain-containing protein 1 [Oxyura jamaicensis]